MTDILHGVAARVKFLSSTISLSLTGNRSVCVRRLRRSKSWRHIGKRRVRVMKKLDQSKVEWIIREKRKGTHNRKIAEAPGISVRWVQKLWKRYKGRDRIVYPAHGKAQKVRTGAPGALCGLLGRLGRAPRPWNAS